MTGKGSFLGRLGVIGLALAMLFCWQLATQPAAAQSTQYVQAFGKLAGTIGTSCNTANYPTCGDGSKATSAYLKTPQSGLVYDAYGNLFITDQGDNTIRRVDAITGVMTTVAGMYSGSICAGNTDTVGDNCPATQATLNAPMQIAFDPQGNLWIADTGNNRIREVTAVHGVVTSTCGCVITTAIGNGNNGGSATIGNGSNVLTAVTLGTPRSIAIDPAGDIFFGNAGNSTIYLVSNGVGLSTQGGGTITKYAGNNNQKTNCIFGVTFTGSCGTYVGPSGADIGASYWLSLDGSNNLYTTDNKNGLVEMIRPSGGTGTGTSYITGSSTSTTSPYGISIVAGLANTSGAFQTGGFSGDDGLAVGAKLSAIGSSGTSGILAAQADQFGNLYVADEGNQRVRLVCNSSNCSGIPAGIAEVLASEGYTPASGYIYTIAGDGVAGSAGLGGPVLMSEVNNPAAIALSPKGDTLAVTSIQNQGVRSISWSNGFLLPVSVGKTSTATQEANLLAGTLGETVESFGFAAGMPADFVVAATAYGTWTGTGYTAPNQCPATGFPVPLAANSECYDPVNFSPTAPGTRNSRLTMTDSNNAQYIMGMTGLGNGAATAFAPGLISTFAGTGQTPGATGDGNAANAAQLYNPGGMALDVTGNLFIADTANDKIRVVYESGTLPNIGSPTAGDIYTYAGNGSAGYAGDGTAANGGTAQLNAPAGVSLDAAGNLYIADATNNVIREVSSTTGYISTVAGNGTAGATGDGSAATAAELNNPQGVASDSYGNLYIADTTNNKIRAVNVNSGVISTVAGTGTGTLSGDAGAATAATLNGPKGVALDSYGNIYIADTANNVVREICTDCASTGSTTQYAVLNAESVTPQNGYIYTIAGNGSQGYSGDGLLGTSAQLNGPTGVWVDAAGDVYIADAGNDSIRLISAATGYITTMAGTNTTAGFAGDNGPATAAQLAAPAAVVADAAGDYYIADTQNDRIAYVNAQPPTLNFGTVDVGNTSATLTTSLENIGNTSLSLSGTPYGPTFSVPAYSQVIGNSSDCFSSVTSLAPGENCQIRLAFAPTTGDSAPQTLTIADNALAGNTTTPATQVINLQGAGEVTVAFTSAASTTFTVGTADSFTVTASGTPAPSLTESGTLPSGVTFVDNGNGTGTLSGTPAAGTAGSYPITFTANNGAAQQNFTLTVAAALSFTSTSSTSFTYGTAGSFTVQTNAPTGTSLSITGGSLPNGILFVDNGDGTGTFSGTATTAGSYPITITASNGGTQAAQNFTLTVNGAVLTITASGATVSYGDAAPTITPGYAGFVGSDSASSLTTAPTCTTTYTTTSAAGSSPATSCSGAAAANYTFSYVSGTVTVNPAPATVTASSPTVSYGAAVPTITPSYSGFVNSETSAVLTTAPTCTTTYTTTTAVGSSPATSCSGAAAANYTFSYVSGTVTVNQASQTITFNAPASPVTYGVTSIALGATASSGLTVSFTTTGPCSASGSTLTITGAGTCAVTANQAGNSSYTAASAVAHSITVNPASVTVTASSVSNLTYGAAVPTITPSYSAFVNSETSAVVTTAPTCTTTYTTTSPVGSYPSSCSGAAAANYTFSYIPGTVTVAGGTAQTITFAAPASPVSYGVTSIALSATANSGLTVSFTTAGPCSVSGSTLTISGVGTCSVTANQAGDSSYAAASPVAHNIIVNPAAATVTASSVSNLTYGSAVPTITPSYSGFVNSETSAVVTTAPTCNTTYTTTSAPGSYPSSCSGAAAANYTFSYVPGLVTVNAASQTITFSAPASPVTYDSVTSIALSATASSSLTVSFTAAGPCSVSGSTLTISGVGTCVVTANQAGNSDYSAASPVAHNITVNPAVVTVTASSVSNLTYGAAVPIITPSYAGFVNGETSAVVTTAPACSTTYTTTSPAGSYPSSCSGAAAANYTFSYVPGLVTVAKASTSLTWSNPVAITYGTALSSTQLDASASGISGSFSYNPAVGTVLGAGTQTLQVTFTPSDGTDYQGASTSVLITVNPAPLRITASSPAVNYGAAVPTITPSYANFVNSETASVLTTAPTCGTTYTPASAVGSSPSTVCFGAVDANYLFIYVNGAVTVNQASQTITFTAPASSVSYGVAPIALSTSASSGLTVSFTTTGPCSVSGSTLSITGVGTCAVTANQAGNTDYAAASPVSHNITVNPAPLTITASSPTVSYGAAVPTITPGYSGFVNGDSASSLTAAPTCTTTYTTTSAVGSYPSSCSGAVDANYSISYTPGSVKVTAQSQTITFAAPNSPVTYGVTSIALNASASSNLTVTFTTTGPCSVSGSTLTITGAGTCAVTADQAGNSDYAAASPVAHNITVNPAPLSITASSATVNYGAAAPTITPSYSGFVNGDTASSLTTAPTCSTTYTTTSAAGSYPSSCSGAVDANYSISYTPGSVTVDNFTVTPPTGGSTSATASASSPAVYSLVFSPGGATTFPNAVTLSLTSAPALPAGATWTFSPASIPANSPATPVTLTITLPANAALQAPHSPFGIDPSRCALGLIFLPLALIRRKKFQSLRGIAWVFLLVLGGALMAGVTGCGGSSGSSPQTYTLTVTATSGSLSNTETLTLTVK